jgi:hypothetical protein
MLNTWDYSLLLLLSNHKSNPKHPLGSVLKNHLGKKTKNKKKPKKM